MGATSSPNPYLAKIRKEIADMLERGFTFKIAWVPFHCGIHGNEMADSRAGQALSNVPEGDLGVYWADLNYVFKKKTVENTITESFVARDPTRGSPTSD